MRDTTEYTIHIIDLNFCPVTKNRPSRFTTQLFIIFEFHIFCLGYTINHKYVHNFVTLLTVNFTTFKFKLFQNEIV